MSTSFKTLILKARHQVYTMLSGHNLSKLHGEGYDFAELREYQMGDDIRKINWTITAKMGKPYVKELHANRELSVVVVSLADGGVYFDAHHRKQRLHTEVGALIGFAALHSNDLFTGVLYTQEQIHTTPPTKQPFDVERFAETIDRTNLLHTRIDPDACMEDLFTRVHKPSLLFVLYDFLEPVDLSLLAQRHEVIAVILRDRGEAHLPKAGEVTLHNPTTQEKHDGYLGTRTQQRYLEKLQAHEEKIHSHFNRYDIRYLTIYTDEEPVEKLMRLFA